MRAPNETRRRLTALELSALSPYIPHEDLTSAILHFGRVPWYLPRRFCAITRGSHVYIRAAQVDADRASWLALLGHELTHVRQYREGMSARRYLWSTLRGYRRSRYELEAFAVQARIASDLSVS